MVLNKIGIILILFFINGKVLCQLTGVDDPVKNFEKLWKEFDDRYANFDLKKINWDEVYGRYRPMINESTNNKDLFDVCCSMLQELGDGHVVIEPNFDEVDIECGAPYELSLEVEFGTEETWLQFESLVDHELIKHGFSKLVRKMLSEGSNFQYRVSDSFGYLRLDEITEQLTFGKYKKSVDEAIEAFNSKQGVILDLRFNGGGWDYNSYVLASRCISADQTIGHYERTKLKGEERYTPLKHKQIDSGRKIQFTKPIVILTSDATASATEVLVLVMRELQQVTIIGDNTEGIFSDMYEFKLPNKWSVSLSNQQYFSMDHENFEGEGIPPDLKAINKRSDLDIEIDLVLKMAMEKLQK